MESILPFIGVALFALLCPLMMIGIPVAGWLIAQVRGQKGSLSMGCMSHGSHGGHAGHDQTSTTQQDLTAEVARLQSELDTLKQRSY